MSAIKRYIPIAVLLPLLLFGCVSTEILDIGEQEELQEPPADEETSPEPETEEAGNMWITLRAPPLKEEGSRYAYLTFDDGPSQNTGRILDVLSEFQVKGTFFFVGSRVLELGRTRAAALLSRVLAEGHFIGLHSMTHDMQRLYRVPGAYRNFINEMRELQNLISELTGGFETSLYRAPYGIKDTFTRDHIRTMSESNLRCWDWNIDTLDWRLTTVVAVMNRIKEEMVKSENPDNAVILLHERPVTVSALPSVIEYFRDLDYTFLPYHPENHFVINKLYNPDL